MDKKDNFGKAFIILISVSFLFALFFWINYIEPKEFEFVIEYGKEKYSDNFNASCEAELDNVNCTSFLGKSSQNRRIVCPQCTSKGPFEVKSYIWCYCNGVKA